MRSTYFPVRHLAAALLTQPLPLAELPRQMSSPNFPTIDRRAFLGGLGLSMLADRFRRAAVGDSSENRFVFDPTHLLTD